MTYQPIEDYGMIGDLHTVALVGKNGSIDFYCCPDFDSPSVFAGLLDENRGGSFQLAPVLEDARHKQLYLPETNVLLTRSLSDEGVAEVSDFMPVARSDDHRPRIVRRAKCVKGQIHFRMVCDLRFDYGRAKHRTHRTDDGVVFESTGSDGMALRLRTACDLRIEEGKAVAEFILDHGESEAFVLEEARPGVPSDSEADAYVAGVFKDTVNFWRAWSRRSQYRGRWRGAVQRSALTLKMLTSARYGSIVASPTFGLPENLGGSRNWDYRYTWIRDASFTLYALIRLGYTAESAAFMHWIEERCDELNPDGSLQIMYGIDGRHELKETILDHLEGYRGSKPVRVGNGAYNQLQLDIYGELMDSVYLYNKYGNPISHDLWRNLTRLLEWVSDNWGLRDEGIWEVRGGRKEFLYSKLMCWVAMDRGIRLSYKRSLPAPIGRWLEVRDEIYQDIMDNFWDPGLRSFVQYRGSKTLDASCLLMPLVKFVSPTDPRWLSTLEAIERELVDDSLVYRYRVGNAAHDGFDEEEGTFSMCSFWFVECLARAGDLDKARFYFEKMLGYANHLGLYAEELGPRGEHLGNFPQAFTHLSMISAAYYLDRQLEIARGKRSSGTVE